MPPRPLRLCFFARTLPAHRAGKGMFHPHIAATALARRGHEITILATSHPTLTEESPLPNLHILYLPNTPSDQYSEAFSQTSAQIFDRLHAMSPFDAAWSDSAGAAGWSQLSKHRDQVPLIAVCHAGLTMMNAGPSRDFFATTHHTMLRRAAAIIAVSRTVAESIASGLPDSASLLRIIPNGADPALFQVPASDTAALRKELGLTDKPILLYLGRVVKEKGGEDLLRAVAMLPEMTRPQVLIIGPGPYGSALRNIASALALPLTLIPGVEHNQAPRHLSLADLFILPSFHAEGLPFTLIEAMLAKRAIIATDIGGVSELIRPEQTGLLTPPRNPAALAAAIQRLLTDKQTRTRLGQSAYALASTMYSLDAMTTRFEKLLIDLAGSKTSPSSLAPPAAAPATRITSAQSTRRNKPRAA